MNQSSSSNKDTLPLMFLHNWRCSGNAINLAILSHMRGRCFKLGSLLGREQNYGDYLQSIARKPDFFLGHFVYGMHREVPDGVRHFTNLRNPLDRLVSGYKKWSDGESFIAWLKNTRESENGITRRLAGVGVENDGAGLPFDYQNNRPLDENFVCTDETYDKARHTLSECVSVFTTEKFVESILLFEKQNGLPPLIFCQGMHYNRSDFSPVDSSTLPSDVVEQIEEKSRFDTKLYEIAVERNKTECNAQGNEFSESVRIRKILYSIAKTDTKEPSTKEIARKVLDGLNSLFRAGFKEDALRVHFLVTLDPAMGMNFEKYAMKYFGKFISESDLGQTREFYIEKSYYSARLCCSS